MFLFRKSLNLEKKKVCGLFQSIGDCEERIALERCQRLGVDVGYQAKDASIHNLRWFQKLRWLAVGICGQCMSL